MGGAVSAGEDNDELVDNLVNADYIKSQFIEAIFRAVDRGNYYRDDARDGAYRDLAWKHGNIHISAPCIYSEVMESLKLQPGHSFLNMGSGTGYLSTMVGLILGPHGINHGIELHADVVEYAYKKLEQFKDNSSALYKYGFCEPEFEVGNCLCLDTGEKKRTYDRIYCGASVPTEYESYISNLLNIGGVLVMPINDQLVQCTRKDENTFDKKFLLPVSFATLVQPHPSESPVSLPDFRVHSLKFLCGITISSILRNCVDEVIPANVQRARIKSRKNKRRNRSAVRTRTIVIPEETSDVNSSNSSSPSTVAMSASSSSDDEEDDLRINRANWVNRSLAARAVEAIFGNGASDEDEPEEENNRDIVANQESAPSSSSDDNAETMAAEPVAASSADSGSQGGEASGGERDRRESTSSGGTGAASESASTSSGEPTITVTEFLFEDEGNQPSERTKRSISITDEEDFSAVATNVRQNTQPGRQLANRAGAIFKRFALENFDSSDSDSSASNANVSISDNSVDLLSDADKIGLNSCGDFKTKKADRYITLMKDRIRRLPLPLTLRVFVNNNRHFD